MRGYHDLDMPFVLTAKFGNHSLRFLALPSINKTQTSLVDLKKQLATWNGIKCNLCKC